MSQCNAVDFSWLGVPVEYKFYGGAVSIFYDDDTHSYVRYVDGIALNIPSATTALHVIDKSAALTQWSSNLCAEYIQAKLADNPLQEAIVERAEVKSWLDRARFAHRDYKEAAADTGKLAHAWIEDYLRVVIRHGPQDPQIQELLANMPEDPRARNGCQAAMAWITKHKVRWVYTERKIYSRLHDYAGTCDGVAYVTACGDPECCGRWIKNEAGRWNLVAETFVDVLAVTDWKTSNDLYMEYELQVAAYLKALNEELGMSIQHRFITRLDKDDASFESRYLPPDTIDRDFNTFRRCLALYRAINDTKESEQAQRKEIKDQIRQDREEAEAASKAARVAESLRKKEYKVASEALYKKLRKGGFSVKDAKALIKPYESQEAA